MQALFRQAEVHHLRMAVRGEHDVRGLQVAVDDVLLVGLVQRFGRFQRDLQGVELAEGPSRQSLPERLPFDVLHDDAAGVAEVEQFMDAADVGMVQRRRQPGFLQQAFAGGEIVAEAAGQDLDGDLAVQERVLREEDFPHPAFAELAGDAVVRQGRADHGDVLPQGACRGP